ncbi:unnamed protein product [Xylocopa violacea]|uniref:Uncharacterized protein n=1 Tax=Xylocopa violacea TaxID=135666 RepID=A0ABP1PG20_XYLVO
MSKAENSGEVPEEGTTGGDALKKDADIYENRGTKKIVRLITVIAYMFSVSFVAIILSGYYLFIWEAPNPRQMRRPLQFSTDPQMQSLISDRIIVQGDDSNTSNISFSVRNFDTDNHFNDYDYTRKHQKQLNESLSLLRNSLVEALQNRMNDSKSSNRNFSRETISELVNYTSSEKGKMLNSTGKLVGRGLRRSSEIMNRMLDNNGTSLTLESSTISGDEANNDRFTSTRNHTGRDSFENIFQSSHNLTKKTVSDRERYKTGVSSTSFKPKTEAFVKKSVKIAMPRYSKVHRSDEAFVNSTRMIMMISVKGNLDIEKNRENLTEYNIDSVERKTVGLNDKSSAASRSRNLELTDNRRYLENVVLNFKETQMERMTTKSVTVVNEQNRYSGIVTTQRQKDLLTTLIEIANTSSSVTPPIMSDDLQSDSSVETKETSTKMDFKID